MKTRLLGAFVLLVIFCLPRLNDFFPPTVPPRSEIAHPNGIERERKPTDEHPSPHIAKTTTGPPAAFLRDPLGFLSVAPVDTLVLLPGIGPVIAERLAGARAVRGRFSRWEDLLAIKGIGPKKLEQLKELASGAD